MPRIARLVVPGVPHHITQRGVDRKQVFHDDRDRTLYLRLLRDAAGLYRLRVWGYCLMPNHVHLIVVPEETPVLWKTLALVHANYARYFNQKRDGCGHLWQARFYSIPLDAAHRWWALAYIERNPVRAGLAPNALAYPWSSACEHTGSRPSPMPLDNREWSQFYTPTRWEQVLQTSVRDEATAERFREATRTGRPFGSEPFATWVEQQTGRDLSRGKPGPKPACTRGSKTAGAGVALNQVAFEFGN